MLRQRRLLEVVGTLADASSNDLLQEERLQEFSELFHRCACETVSNEIVEVVLQTVAVLDNLGTSGDALHQLVMVLLEALPEMASAEGLTSEQAPWQGHRDRKGAPPVHCCHVCRHKCRHP